MPQMECMQPELVGGWLVGWWLVGGWLVTCRWLAGWLASVKGHPYVIPKAHRRKPQNGCTECVQFVLVTAPNLRAVRGTRMSMVDPERTISPRYF